MSPSTPPTLRANTIRTRLRQVRKIIKQRGGGALLISSAPEIYSSADQFFPYRPNSDFFYLTGSRERALTLLIPGEGRSSLYARKPDSKKLLWDGAPEDPQILAERLDLDLILHDSPERDIREKLAGTENLYFQNTPNSIAWRIAQQLIELPSHMRARMPARFSHCDTILTALRMHKDPDEIALIRYAARITAASLQGVLPLIQAGVSEREIALTLEHNFRSYGADVAFRTICACGPSAAVLHYDKLAHTLRKGELLLIDCGASFQGYNADMTRVLAVSGEFSGMQRLLYTIVDEAKRAAIAKIKPGVAVKKIYDTGVAILTAGLKELGILKGSISSLLAKKAFLPYFPHGIGHSLGLDVHDVGDLRSSSGAILEAGMVLTIEPGLYFSKRSKFLPACGVRLEDDIVVTRRGHEILSSEFPSELR